jgi:RimJ/RimL family protein N-acetyltransferase
MLDAVPENASIAVPDDLPVGDPVAGDPARVPGRDRRDGRFVSIEPIDAARDAEALYRRSHDGSPEAERMWTYLAYGPFASASDMRAWLEALEPSNDPLFLTVSDAGGPAGVVSCMSIEPAMRRIEIGHIWYAPDAQRSEANTEVVFLLLREAFEDLGYRRVEWKCDSRNERSRAAALRLGFTFEGVFRKHMIIKGRNRDTAWFSMTDDEWPSARVAFERWLAAPSDARPSLASLRPSDASTGSGWTGTSTTVF